jgi:hypothetical protein
MLTSLEVRWCRPRCRCSPFLGGSFRVGVGQSGLWKNWCRMEYHASGIGEHAFIRACFGHLKRGRLVSCPILSRLDLSALASKTG